MGNGAGNGTGSLTVTGEAGRVAAAMERVDDVARRLRGDGDSRTLTQLRSDVALDLLLYGWVYLEAIRATVRTGRPGRPCAAHVRGAGAGRPA